VTSLSARRRHPLATVLVLGLGLFLVGGLYAAVGHASSAGAASTTATTQQVSQGRQLYLTGCSSCHGLNAQGGSNAPTLIGVGAAAVDFQVGTGRMPLAGPTTQAVRGPVQYSDEDIAALAAYVASLAPGPAIPTAEQLDYTDGDLAQGGVLFRTNCASCHNFAGRGGALTRGKFAPTITESSAKHIYEAMITGPQAMPVFGNQTLTPDEKKDITQYIRTLSTAPDNPGGLALGRVGPVAEGVFVWVVGIILLGAAAVWIGAKVS
jgi:ubiquinol-cytochrome c reductase cytochrome c subunit